jgi:peptidoglycan/xylan/chitin deacetylase (PgdA/CDA1 family)
VRAFDTQLQNPKGIARRILQKTQPGGVILLHDGSDSARNEDRTATLQALPEILKGLKDRNMEFLTLDKLFGISKEVG